MVGCAVTKTRFAEGELMRKTKAGSIQSLGHAGGAIRIQAIRSIKKSPYPAPPGQPVHTRQGLIQRAIIYSVEKEKQTVVVGPSERVIGIAGKPHEHGGLFRGRMYPARPFMWPALLRIRHRLPKYWAKSIK
jgi:hypothetical protein